MSTQYKIDKVDKISKLAMQGDILKALDCLKLQAIGCCMLAKIKSGKKYRIEASSTKACKAVTFYPLRGKNPTVTHDAWSVLSSIQCRSNGYLNGFDLI
jgi:hypothetical protein